MLKLNLPSAVNDNPGCSSSEEQDASGLSVVKHSIASSLVETLFYLLPFILCLADFDMIAWDSHTKSYFPPHQIHKFKAGAPNSQWGPHNVHDMGPNGPQF